MIAGRPDMSFSNSSAFSFGSASVPAIAAHLSWYEMICPFSVATAARSTLKKEDRENFLNKVRGTELERSLKTAENTLDEIMNKCSYMWISLADLFKVAKA